MPPHRLLPTPRRTRPDVRLRDLRPGEGHVFDTVFDAMSDRSRYLRFHAPTPRLGRGHRAVLHAVDGDRHVAVAAEVRQTGGWVPVGVGRLIRTAPDRAEIAVSVADDQQGRGIGTSLVRALRDRAAAQGIVELTADVLLENKAMLAVLRRELPASRVDRDGPSVQLTSRLSTSEVPPRVHRAQLTSTAA